MYKFWGIGFVRLYANTNKIIKNLQNPIASYNINNLQDI